MGCFRVVDSSTPSKTRKQLLLWKRMQRKILATSSSLEGSTIIGSLLMFQQLSISRRNMFILFENPFPMPKGEVMTLLDHKYNDISFNKFMSNVCFSKLFSLFAFLHEIGDH